MLIDYGFIWDSSQGVPPRATPVWPYTYDYKMPHKWVSSQSHRGTMREVFTITERRSILAPNSTNLWRNVINSKSAFNVEFNFEKCFSIHNLSLRFELWSEFRLIQNYLRCRTDSCPTRQFPGVWEIPLNSHYIGEMVQNLILIVSLSYFHRGLCGRALPLPWPMRLHSHGCSRCSRLAEGRRWI